MDAPLPILFKILYSITLGYSTIFILFFSAMCPKIAVYSAELNMQQVFMQKINLLNAVFLER